MVASWKEERLRTLAQQAQARRENRLKSFKPYPKQSEFFEMGEMKRERLLMAGNQVGKSEAGAFEAACHLTGLYPDWWIGKRFTAPTKGWAAGEGGMLVRDVSQTKLCGIPGDEAAWGTGMIPKSLLLGKAAGHGVSDGYDNIRVRHVSGGVSTLAFKSYEQGRTKFQGTTLDFVWLDEEPPLDIYSECMARLTGDGVVYLTFTPLNGFNHVVPRFLRDDSPAARRDRGVIRMGLKHAEHFTAEEKERRLAGYPQHERAARENGDPMLGSGAVFEEVIESDISTNLQITGIPKHWPLLWGIDFGIAHPFAAVLIAWDRDTDIIYVVDCFRMTGGTPLNHAARMKAIAAEVPVSWPHDGAAREAGSGEPLAALYKQQGLKMRSEHAQHASGGYSTEGGIAEMLTRMRDGRFKVAAHLSDWWDEFRGYHRDKGMIVKINDDLMSATRIAVMDHRFARSEPLGAGLGWRPPAQPTRTDFDLFTGRPFASDASGGYDPFG